MASGQQQKQLIVLTKVDCVAEADRSMMLEQIKEDIVASGLLAHQDVSVLMVSSQAKIGLQVLVQEVSGLLDCSDDV